MTNQNAATAVFEAKGLVKRFGKTRALDELNLTVAPGLVTVLLGANGAGKSTLLRLALGVLKPDAGQLTVVRRDPVREPDAVRRLVGYVPDKPDAPPWMTVAELCKFSKAHYPSWNQAVADQLIETLDVPANGKLGNLSKGQGMKAMLVLALAHEPELLLLDEPFGGLDPLVREDVLRTVIGALRESGRTVLCATHELDIAARIADRVAILSNGRVHQSGSVAEVLGSDEPGDLPGGLRAALVAAAEQTTETATC